MSQDKQTSGSLEESTLSISAVDYQARSLLGEVLTVIDAAISNVDQCKATKDIIKLAFRRKLQHLAEIATRIPGADIDHGFISIPVIAYDDPSSASNTVKD